MPLEFTCPHCGTRTSVDDRFAGQTGPCRTCGAPVTVPGAPSEQYSYAPPPPSSSSSATWIVALACVGGAVLLCGGILAALLLPAVQAARQAARRNQCVTNLRQISLAMLNYHDVWNSFPPAYIADENGRPKHSWRVLILPYLEQQTLYDRYDFNEPWDGPHNSQLAALMPPVYACLTDSASTPGGLTTNYAVIAGPGTLFDPDVPATMRAVTDGTSNTLLVVEASKAGINWMEPRDLDVNQMSFRVNGSPNEISSEHPGGAQAAFADGHVSFLQDSAAAQTLRALITKAGGEPIPGGF